VAYTSPSITPSGTTWAQYKAGGLVAILINLIAANKAATAAPTAATVSATGGGSTGGLLAAGVYRIAVSESDGIGETTATETAGTFTVAAGNIPQVTFAALQAGNVSRNVYLSPAGGASGSELRYATGITAGTFNLAVAAPTNSFAGAPPTVNSTAFSYTNPTTGEVTNAVLSYADFWRQKGALDRIWQDSVKRSSNFAGGEPVTFAAAVTKLRHSHTIWAMIAQAHAEEGALIDANAGTLAPGTNPITVARVRRSWP